MSYHLPDYVKIVTIFLIISKCNDILTGQVLSVLVLPRWSYCHLACFVRKHKSFHMQSHRKWFFPYPLPDCCLFESRHWWKWQREKKSKMVKYFVYKIIGFQQFCVDRDRWRRQFKKPFNESVEMNSYWAIYVTLKMIKTYHVIGEFNQQRQMML